MSNFYVVKLRGRDYFSYHSVFYTTMERFIKVNIEDLFRISRFRATDFYSSKLIRSFIGFIPKETGSSALN